MQDNEIQEEIQQKSMTIVYQITKDQYIIEETHNLLKKYYICDKFLQSKIPLSYPIQLDKYHINNKIIQKINYQQSSQRIFQRLSLKGGGNLVTKVPNICSQPDMSKKESGRFSSQQQGISSQQMDDFLDNLENKIQELFNSSKNLQEQDQKVAFSNNMRWIQVKFIFMIIFKAHQMIAYEIINFLQQSELNQDTIDLFEDAIIKMIQIILNVLKHKNVFLGQLVAQQAAVYATSVYRFYLSQSIQGEKLQHLQNNKQLMKQKIEAINHKIQKMSKIHEISSTALDQSIKILDNFVISLPDKPTNSPLTSILGGVGKLVMSGGTAGWGDLITGMKDGISNAINEKMKQNDLENYIFYVNLEKFKFEILKTLLDKDENQNQQNEESKENDGFSKQQIVQNTLENFGRMVEQNNNWFQKYLFVQTLSEFVTYQPLITEDKLEEMLNKIPNLDVSVDIIWKKLVSSDKILQFESQKGRRQKQGFLNLGKALNLEIEVDNKKKKEKKDKKSDNIVQKQQQMISQLDNMLNSLDPFSQQLKKYIIEGEKGKFKGLLQYTLEGLDDQESMTSVIKEASVDIFEGKSTLEI